MFSPVAACNIADHEAWFATFTAEYRATEQGETGPIDLKIEHTAMVLAHARRIVDEVQPAPTVARCALLGALYHDVGRFPQYAQYHTFSDPRSVNHGYLGARTLHAHRPLAHEPRPIQRLVTGSVVLHNRYVLPAGISEDLRLVTDVVRDADKLDIFRIMAAHLDPEGPHDKVVVLHLQDQPDRFTQKIVDDARAGRPARYADLRYINDFRLLLGSWVSELRFDVTRHVLCQSRLMHNVLGGLPDIAILQRTADQLLAQLERQD